MWGRACQAEGAARAKALGQEKHDYLMHGKAARQCGWNGMCKGQVRSERWVTWAMTLVWLYSRSCRISSRE